MTVGLIAPHVLARSPVYAGRNAAAQTKRIPVLVTMPHMAERTVVLETCLYDRLKVGS